MVTVSELVHPTIKLSNGAKVVVLNTGAVIGPESEAMLQALHSRSIGGIDSHMEILSQKGSEKFMSTYYVGYGHKSIGDCGTCTIFIEGVSMLVAKAIQDWPLYSGQEASTRYIDFATQAFIDPIGSTYSSFILEKWRNFYLRGLQLMIPALKDRFPRSEGEKYGIYEKAIGARAFDIMRGFLPSGASTNLAWHSNLRQVADKLLVLRHHPLQEVREVAEAIECVVSGAYPNSFERAKRHTETENYNRFMMNNAYLYSDGECPEFEIDRDDIDRSILKEYREMMSSRPPKTELPKHIAEAGTVRFRYLLDFGSFRDLQRQRPVVQRMPLVTMAHGFGEWYLEELTSDLRKEALQLLGEQKSAIESLAVPTTVEQYYIPMGYKLPNRLTGNLHALTYLVELRATRFVHPTARRIAIQMAEVLSTRFASSGLVLHLDKEPDRFDSKRGEHDIVSKETR